MLEDAADDELMVLPTGTLADEGNGVDFGDEGTGTIMVAELETVPLEAVTLGDGIPGALLDPEAEDGPATELRGLAGTELEYCDGSTGTTTVVEDTAVELDPLLTPEAEGVNVGYTAELEMTGADRLDDVKNVEVELGGNGMTTV